jgi:hypothetical protein
MTNDERSREAPVLVPLRMHIEVFWAKILLMHQVMASGRVSRVDSMHFLQG